MLRRVLCLLGASCVARPAPVRVPAPPRIAIVASESGAQGARLVVLDERGDRQFALMPHPGAVVRDTHPAISPDGAWIVFASSRGRTFDRTSLWIAPLLPDAVPHRLTAGTAIDSHPVWTRDGRAIVFASTRGGTFDLYRLAIDRGVARGEPEQLTHGAGHEVTPTIAADGTIFYAEVSPAPGGQTESHLEARAPDGSIRRVTDGPSDASPALSPDDQTIAFARPREHNGTLDGELWTMRRDATAATQLVDLPLTDESGPVWSPDGRFVFATSVLRGAAGNAVFSSVIVVDTRATRPSARMLEDRLGVIARLTPAIAKVHLDATVLARDPEYLPELARIMAAAIAAQTPETK